ncbi:hypothetical protein FB451DRAFT_106429 [Mycena latifolia]|nr:hypothetical protein FB451DRAFT_106429 [Mycena latifolia]
MRIHYGIGVGGLEPEPIDLNIAPGTRHHTLLTTNEPPLETDSIFVKPAISNAGLRLAKIDDEIARLRDRLERLEEERASLSVFHLKNLAVLSPLRRMPAEVLCEIFSFTLPSPSEAEDWGRFDVKKSPWILGHICSHWRVIALASPSLWSLVVIKLQDDDPEGDYIFGGPGTVFDPRPIASAYPLVLLKTQIQRARNLYVFFSAHPSQSSHAIALFQLLVLNCMLWKEFEVTLVPEMLPHMAPLRDHVPLLQRLAIKWHSDSLPESAVEIDCFHAAPSLQTISARDKLSVSFPAHRLTQYDLVGTTATYLRILTLAVNLVQACIFIHDVQPTGFSGQVIDLIHLRQLYVTETAILNSFRLPALDSLGYLGNEVDAPSILVHLHVHVRSLFDRSAHAPRRLCVVGFPDAETTGRILHDYPSIIEFATVINLGRCPSDRSIFSYLTTAGPSVAPQLHTIFLGIDSRASSDYTAFTNSLQLRWRAENRALTCAGLYIFSGPSPDREVLDALESLRRDGLDMLLMEGSAAETVLTDWVYSLPDCL